MRDHWDAYSGWLVHVHDHGDQHCGFGESAVHDQRDGIRAIEYRDRQGCGIGRRDYSPEGVSMNEWPKMAEDFGVCCLMMCLIWKLVDKWAGEFLAAHRQQAVAMTTMADAVKQSMTDSREILIAVRVQSQQIGDLKTLIEERLR
jgi:hypothetical protein